jgi:hypothetical protein
MSISSRPLGQSIAFRVGTVLLICALYIAALNLPVADIVVTPDDSDFFDSMTFTFFGADALGGWSGIGLIPESANIALLVGGIALLICRVRVAMVIGALGIAGAASAPFVFEIYLDDLRAAYYLWLACMVILFLAALVAARASAKSREAS